MSLELVQHQQVIGLNDEAVELWILYRRTYFGKKFTSLALQMATTKMLQWSEEDQMRLVMLAIEGEWTTLYWKEPQKAPQGISTRDTDIRDDLTDTSWAK